MGFDQIVILVMGLFTLAGGIDRIIGNRLGLSAAFERGIITSGQLMLSMTGIIVLSPVISQAVSPVIVPIYRLLGADPAMCAGSLFACDMGAAQLAARMAENQDAARFSGILVSSMLGVTVSFTIPVAMSVLNNEDKPYAAKGILCGVLTIPVGLLLGGYSAGFEWNILLRNMIPVLLVVLFIAVGLLKWEKALLKGFGLFAKMLIALSTIGLSAGGFELTTGITLIPGLGSRKEAFMIVGEIGIVLSGAFPLMVCVTKALHNLFHRLAEKFGISDQAVLGLVTSLVNSIATFDMISSMDKRGKVINMAFAVSGAFAIGDHLAFTAGYDSEMIPALIIGKLSAGITAGLVAYWLCRWEEKHV